MNWVKIYIEPQSKVEAWGFYSMINLTMDAQNPPPKKIGKNLRICKFTLANLIFFHFFPFLCQFGQYRG